MYAVGSEEFKLELGMSQPLGLFCFFEEKRLAHFPAWEVTHAPIGRGLLLALIQHQKQQPESGITRSFRVVRLRVPFILFPAKLFGLNSHLKRNALPLSRQHPLPRRTSSGDPNRPQPEPVRCWHSQFLLSFPVNIFLFPKIETMVVGMWSISSFLIPAILDIGGGQGHEIGNKVLKWA